MEVQVWWWVAACGGIGGIGNNCEIPCPVGTRRVEALSSDLLEMSTLSWSVDQSCEVLCEAEEPCRAPNVPVVDGASDPPVFECKPLDGFADIPLPSEVDTRFGEQWQPVVPGLESEIQSTSTVYTEWRQARAGDADRDGWADLYLLSETEVGVGWGSGDGTFEPGKVAPLPIPEPDPEWMTLADFNGDGLQDLIWVSRSSYTLSWAAGQGHVVFSEPLPVGNEPRAQFFNPWTTVTDLDADGMDDLILSTDQATSLWLVFGSPRGPREPIPVPGVAYWPYQSVGDLDGDGLLDLLLGSAEGTVVRQVAPRTFQVQETGLWAGAGQVSSAFDLHDLDGDGRADLWAHLDLTRDVLVRRSTASGFEPARLEAGAITGEVLKLGEADLDGDGQSEWLGYQSIPEGVYPGLPRISYPAIMEPRDGTFGWRLAGASFLPEAAVAHADFDGDRELEAAFLDQDFSYGTPVVVVDP